MIISSFTLEEQIKMTRRLIELLKMYPDKFIMGLCSFIQSYIPLMELSIHEVHNLKSFIDDITNQEFKNSSYKPYWFKPGSLGLRLEYLKELLIRLEAEGVEK